MNIALIGYGRMGHEVEDMAVKRGHAVKLKIDKDNTDDINRDNFKDIDAAIEFTSPDSAFDIISRCLNLDMPVVSGTTGWLDDYERAADLSRSMKISFIHSSNFSIGVNILFRLNRELAGYMSRYSDYIPSIEEIHHVKKLDAPSGTAIKLSEGIADNHSLYEGWSSDEKRDKDTVPVRSVREGAVIGTHSVVWESDIDLITLKHEAKNRKGLALGAVIAAEFIHNREGVFTMDDVMGLR